MGDPIGLETFFDWGPRWFRNVVFIGEPVGLETFFDGGHRWFGNLVHWGPYYYLKELRHSGTSMKETLFD